MTESDDSPKESRNYLNIAQRASQALLVLINELLDFQRWEHEQITLVTEPTDLHQFLREIQTTTDILFDDSAIKFSALIRRKKSENTLCVVFLTQYGNDGTTRI